MKGVSGALTFVGFCILALAFNVAMVIPAVRMIADAISLSGGLIAAEASIANDDH